MEHLIECDKLVKSFRGRGLGGAKRAFKAVDGVSLRIGRNQSYGLVGESGCGKTTFARALLFLDPPSSGSVGFGGTRLETLKRRELKAFRKRMQIVFQDPNNALNPKMSIFESLSEGLVNRGIGRDERAERIKKLLDLVGISYSYKNRFPHEFSGGQKQRIVIARALSMEPEFLVLDEPVSNLDVSIQAQIINLLSDLKAEFSLTYLFISHDLNLVSYMCDTIGVMFKGKIVEEAAAETLLSSPRHPYTQKLLSSIPGGARWLSAQSLRQEEEEPGAAPVRKPLRQAAAGCPYFSLCPRGDEECLSSAPELRDIEPGHVVSCHKVEPDASRQC